MYIPGLTGSNTHVTCPATCSVAVNIANDSVSSVSPVKFIHDVAVDMRQVRAVPTATVWQRHVQRPLTCRTLTNHLPQTIRRKSDSSHKVDDPPVGPRHSRHEAVSVSLCHTSDTYSLASVALYSIMMSPVTR